ncbi:MSCRAMM family adhesin SdrC [Microbacterium sp. kSW2-24]|uniref:MSCRAMM family adhesin SdrC n=1 Tax=Microbacterium galbinum TaxID=2851646 RepID=UPI001FFCF3F4|nr:MSCRAMM family adhesin SdrC [Microbacterium galbinum]MCK2021577.1 MSCRAMM family adhesin SdrC [Microbacterium galbinum]
MLTKKKLMIGSGIGATAIVIVVGGLALNLPAQAATPTSPMSSHSTTANDDGETNDDGPGAADTDAETNDDAPGATDSDTETNDDASGATDAETDDDGPGAADTDVETNDDGDASSGN